MDTRMPNLVLCGPTNNGKSMLLEKFTRAHPQVVWYQLGRRTGYSGSQNSEATGPGRATIFQCDAGYTGVSASRIGKRLAAAGLGHAFDARERSGPAGHR
jgi:TniB protein